MSGNMSAVEHPDWKLFKSDLREQIEYLLCVTDVLVELSSFFAALCLIKPGELYILDLLRPEAWPPALTAEMLMFEDQQNYVDQISYQWLGVNFVITLVSVDAPNRSLCLVCGSFFLCPWLKLLVLQMLPDGSTQRYRTVYNHNSKCEFCKKMNPLTQCCKSCTKLSCLSLFLRHNHTRRLQWFYLCSCDDVGMNTYWILSLIQKENSIFYDFIYTFGRFVRGRSKVWHFRYFSVVLYIYFR